VGLHPALGRHHQQRAKRDGVPIILRSLRFKLFFRNTDMHEWRAFWKFSKPKLLCGCMFVLRPSLGREHQPWAKRDGVLLIMGVMWFKLLC
jgi:hypothetical protein